MATSSAQASPVDTRIEFYVDVPERLNNKVINEMINMLSSRLRYLLGIQYKRQIHHRVTARMHGKATP